MDALNAPAADRSLRYSRHGAVRAQKRCIPPVVVDWLVAYGRRAPGYRGAELVYFDKSTRRALERDIGAWIYGRIEKKLDAYLILSSDGHVITAGYRRAHLRKDGPR